MAITRKTIITFVFTILFFGSSVLCRTPDSAVTPASVASAVTPDNGYGELNTDICFTVMSPCNWRYPHGEAMCNDYCKRNKTYSGHCDAHGRCCCVI
ncbi:hypothetical protein HID58_016485 [Brassica napus]|uniref:BnaA04g24930D protein n=3 Tax=Brassica TaxID=3705 RepID=A0A078GYT0_BRANA|nr:hypothetical protein HID58_016485 [Brassica napus]CAF2300608.1 unnamed protein product [Brassica napus]CAG7908489.1 unnamed protein product [Brassica rapa]CDY30392.1 BnaA04g24930D [Brassica napus]VDD15967.1 unnamed protein product [Brassica rapa]